MPVVLKPSAPSLPESMLRTLLIAIVVNTLLCAGFVLMRYGISGLEETGREEEGDV
jgi:hypothetical protein